MWLEAVTTLTDHPLNSINIIIILNPPHYHHHPENALFVWHRDVQMLIKLEGSLTRLHLGARFHCIVHVYNNVSWVLNAHKRRLHEEETATIGCWCLCYWRTNIWCEDAIGGLREAGTTSWLHYHHHFDMFTKEKELSCQYHCKKVLLIWQAYFTWRLRKMLCDHGEQVQRG